MRRRRARFGPTCRRAIHAATAIATLGTAACSANGGARPPAAATTDAPAAITGWAAPGGSVNGYGHAHRPLSTDDPGAQALYDRGLALVAGYDWLLASRALRGALDREPGSALLHLALADVHRELEDNAAVLRHRDAARAAAGGGGSDRERAWLGLALAREEAIAAPEPERRAADLAYRAALDAYLTRWPDDPDALVLRGDAESSHLAGHGRTGGEEAIRWYETALARAPDHLAANHYLAHALENTGRLAEAAERARRFAELAPASPHAQHMAGHPLPRLGRWREARAWFERADRLHRERFETGALAPASDWHFGHNLRMLGVVLWRLGDEERAADRLREAFERDTIGGQAGADCAPWLELLLLRERYPEAATAARECIARPAPAARAVGWALHGEALLGLGREREAGGDLARAIELFTPLWESADTPADHGRLDAVVRSMRALRGKLAVGSGDRAEGERWLLQFAEDGIAGHDLDHWASGLLRLHELEAYARRTDLPWLAAALSERIDALPPAEPAEPIEPAAGSR
jgi:tetratricopeptide (TPR) repeat protein